MKILKGFANNKQFLFVMLIAFFFFILRLPSLFEPLWYGDEGIYQVIGNSLNHGNLLYKEIFDNKPPLLYWLYSILHSDQFSVRLTSLIFGILSIAIFFLLSKKLFKKNVSISYLTTFIFTLLFGLPTLEGNIANAENFLLLPVVASAFLITSQKRLFAAGLLLGIAFLFKIVAVFDLVSFLIFYFILNFDSTKKQIKLFRIIAGFFIPIFLTSFFFIANGTFADFIKATFLSNIAYVNYGNRIGSLPVLLFVKLVILGTFLFYIFTKRKSINESSLFVLIWFAFSLFNAFFSQRPYTHYLLILIPSFSLAIGLILLDKKHRKLIAVFFIVALFVIIKIFGIPNFGKSINYYQNYMSYAAGKKTMISYQEFFDRKTPFDYEISRFIKPKLSKDETVFIWGNNAQLYQLVNVIAPTKYIVAYHIINYKDGLVSAKMALDKTKPRFIVVMPNETRIPFSLENYSAKIDINNTIIYERVF